MLSEAFALTVTDAPETVAPDVGVVMETVGAMVSVAVLIVTVTDLVTLPPGPVHESVNVLEVVRAPVDWLPLIALVPDQIPEPEAVQEVALVED